jgi:TetR/AcrR family transcriptional repressor of nem operon
MALLNDQPSSDSKDTRSRIVSAARELFWTQGYEATSLKQILEKANALSGSLYYFFKGKQDLLQAVLDWYLENLEPEVLQPAFGRASDPIERIFAILQGYRVLLNITGCTKGCPIGNLALEVDDQPAAREKIALNFTNWVKAIESCLDAAADRLPAGLDRKHLAQFVLTVMEGGVMQARAYRSLEPFDNAVAQLRDYFGRLLRPPAPEDASKTK